MRRIPLLFAISLLPQLAWGWGLDGHRVVCEIAWQELDASGRSLIRSTLPATGRYSRFTEACTWADEIRQQSRYLVDKNRHYVNIAPGDTAISLARHCPDGCVVSAISIYRDIAAGQPDPDRTRREALMFLGHFVGDIHQPLHAGYRNDAGGNGLAIRYYGRNPRCRTEGGSRRCDYQLHRLWDSLLLGDLKETDTPERYGAGLQARITDAERAAWKRGSPEDWANESVEIVVNDIYPIADQEYVGRPYLLRHGPTVERRLKQAGVRLAMMIEEIASGGLAAATAGNEMSAEETRRIGADAYRREGMLPPPSDQPYRGVFVADWVNDRVITLLEDKGIEVSRFTIYGRDDFNYLLVLWGGECNLDELKRVVDALAHLPEAEIAYRGRSNQFDAAIVVGASREDKSPVPISMVRARIMESESLAEVYEILRSAHKAKSQ